MTEYTLKHWFEEAQVSPIPDWFADTGIKHPVYGWIKPRWHQITGLNGAFAYQRFSIFDDMGTGKTLIAHAYCAWHAHYGNRPICIMPPGLLEQFRNKFYESFPGIESRMSMLIYRGTPKEREQIARKLLNWQEQQFPIVIMSPQIFLKEFTLFKQLGCMVIVGDEARYLSEETTKTYAAIEDFMCAYGDKCALSMTGTPAYNDLRDLYGYIRFNTPDAYRSRRHFNHRHVEFKPVKIRVRNKQTGGLEEREIFDVDHFKNLELLYTNLYRQARRVEKDQALDLPPVQIIPFEVELSGKHKDKYDEFCRAKVLIFDDGQAISGEQTATMRAVAMQAVIRTDMLQVNEDSAVFAGVDELLAEINLKHNKVVIGAYFRETVHRLVERYKEFGALPIHGETSSQQKEAHKQAFINDPSCRLLIMNYQSGGVGLDGLQDVCSYAIAAEPTSVPGDFKQWRDRLNRSGQKNKTVIYYIVAKGTVWVKTTANMVAKDAVNQRVVSRESLLAELRGED